MSDNVNDEAAGYPEAGSRNSSTIHRDMIYDMRKDAEIQADGIGIYREGKCI
jgi:hypothetical protein